jgi:hypothetical protein
VAIAHDTQTRFPATDGPSGTNSVDTTTGDRTFSHAGAAGAVGAAVVVICTGNTAVVSGVLYGGVTMTLSATANDTSEPGRVDIYTLVGGSFPGGTQTVTLQSATATAKWASCSTVTGASAAVEDTSTVDTTTSTDPQVNMGTTREAMAYAGIASGRLAPATAGITGSTVQFSNDYGALMANSVRWTSVTAAGTTAIGASVASDDWCIAAVAFAEPIWVKAGNAISGSLVSGADVFEATEAGSAAGGARLSGASEYVPAAGTTRRAQVSWIEFEIPAPTGGGITYQKAGTVISGTSTSGADVATFSETGAVFMGQVALLPDTVLPPEIMLNPDGGSSGLLLSGASEHIVGGGATYTKAGTAATGTRASGADVFEATETGSALAGSNASGADVFEATETGSVLAGSLLSGDQNVTLNRAGNLLAGTRASGADVFEATETGSVLAGTLASGPSEHSVGGITYEKTGAVISGSRASGADAFEATETGTVQAGSRQSAPDQFTATETASPAAGTRASGADVFEATETGSAIAGSRASGVSEHVVSGVFNKTGLAASGTRASGPDVFTATETGAAISGSRASGTSAFVGSVVYQKSGVAAAGARTSGADAYISIEIGLAVMGSLMGGDSQALRARSGLAALGSRLQSEVPGILGTVDGRVLVGVTATGDPSSAATAAGRVLASVGVE